MTFIEHNAALGKPRAIDTVYKGYKFRSRLEARWAVFFETAGHTRWLYEDEGYQLENGWYLPDFRITDPKTGRTLMYVEVKPGPKPDPYLLSASNDVAKVRELSQLMRCPVDMVFGDPYEVMQNPSASILSAWHWSPLVKSFELSPKRAKYAADMSRQARFEHGAQS
jgi:hypothetical protein